MSGHSASTHVQVGEGIMGFNDDYEFSLLIMGFICDYREFR